MTILSFLAKGILGLLGWRVDGTLPDVPKAVIIGAYHTSNWDGVLLILAGLTFKRRVHWLGKHTLFAGIAGPFVRLLGGVPINRSRSSGAVDQAVEAFNQRDEFLLAVAPEGTRRRVARWKRGFYYIAHGAGVPLLLGAPDYASKRILIGPVIETTGDIEADMVQIRAFYEQTTPKFPQNAGPIVIGIAPRHEAKAPDDVAI